MNVLTIAVHPDDETLGCGATLVKMAQAGADLHWLIVTSAHPEEFPGADRAAQEAQVERVRAGYPFATLSWLKFPSTRLDTLPLKDLIAAIRASVEAVRPDTVFVPHWSDGHSDHRVTFDACQSVLRPGTMSQLGVRRVLATEVSSQTESAAPGARPAFTPNVFVDVTATLERKLELFALYGAEVHASPGPRSLDTVRALATVRGAAVGVGYAEAFYLVRELA